MPFQKGHKINLGRKINPPQEIQCMVCGKIFKDYLSNKRKVCSCKCAAIYIGKIHQGKSTTLGKHWKCPYPFSKEHREKLRRSTIERIKNNSKFGFQGGKEHWAWKGGVCSENYKLRRSRKFQNWRKAIFDRDNYICWTCGERSGNGYRVTLHPHHLKRFAENPKSRFALSNGLTLCEFCHKTYTKFGEI